MYSLTTGGSAYTPNLDDWVDGGQDKQVDIISVDEGQGEADVYIIQAKFVDTFSSNNLILMANGLQWIFTADKAALATLNNTDFRDKIKELRSTLSGYGYSNVRIHCYFATRATHLKLSEEFKQELDQIKAKYDNGSFESFEIDALSSEELIELSKRVERRARAVDVNLPIRYDANTGSIIKYQSQGQKGVICTCDAKQIADLVNADKHGSIFESNIRRFLGKSRSVNIEISNTASDAATSHLFWFLNNGITIVCDSADVSSDPDEPKIKIRNLQIVNGCQTASSLAHASEAGTLRPDTRVMLRIFETKDASLSSKIVLTTNNQNRISTRDLKANDSVQQDMQAAFETYGFLYEHKAQQFAGTTLKLGQSIVSNEAVGQAYLAVAMRIPSDARRRKYKLWDDYYAQVFSGKAIEAHVLCTLICGHCSAWTRAKRKLLTNDEETRKIVANGMFHIARIAAHLWRKTDAFTQATAELNKEITQIRNNAGPLTPIFQNALKILKEEIDKNPALSVDIDVALRSTLLDSALTHRLNSKSNKVTES